MTHHGFSSPPTQAEILVLVNERKPNLTDEQKQQIVSKALSLLADPRFLNKRWMHPMMAVKISIHQLDLSPASD